MPNVAELFKKAGLTEDKSDLEDLLDVIIREPGFLRNLKEVNIEPEQLDKLAKRALADFWAPTNPIPLADAVQVREILETVVG